MNVASAVAAEIIRKVAVLEVQPLLGRPLRGRREYRELVLRVLNADYIFQYRVSEDRVVMLRVFHGRERRE